MSYLFNFDKSEYLAGKRPTGCVLCLIAQKSDQAVNLLVHEEENFLVSANLYPYNPGHLMIFPRQHAEHIKNIGGTAATRLYELEVYFIDLLEKLYKPAGFNIGYNMKAAAGASLAHIHKHIIPRYFGETGILDLLGNARLLVESPVETQRKIIDQISSHPIPEG